MLSVSKIFSLRSVIIAAVFGVVFSFLFSYGTELANDYDALVSLKTLINAIPTFLIVFFIMVLLQNLDLSGVNKRKNIFNFNKTKFFLFFSFLGLWIFFLMSNFPGYWGYDAIYQFKMFSEGSLTTHHPIIHTYLLSGLVEMGQYFFDSYETGLLLYTIIQMIVLAYAITRGIIFAGKHSFICGMITCVWGLFIPFNGILAISSTKDIFFAAFFLLFSVNLLEGTLSPKFFDRRWYFIKIILLSFLVFSFRNNGIYVLAVTAFFFLLFNRKNFKKILIIFAVIAGIWLIYTIPVHRALHIESGPKREMFSIPCQQISEVYNNSSSSLTDEQRAKIKEYVPDAEKMLYRLADNTKNTFNEELHNKNKGDFFNLWIKVGLDNPKIYFNAFANTTYGFWYIDTPYPDEQMWHPLLEWYNLDIYERVNKNGDYLVIDQKAYFPGISDLLYDYAEEATFQDIPVFSQIGKPGIYTWILLGEIAIFFYKKKYRYIIAVLPCFIYFLTCLLGPVCLMRYSYPIALVSMVMIAPALTGAVRAKRFIFVHG